MNWFRRLALAPLGQLYTVFIVVLVVALALIAIGLMRANASGAPLAQPQAAQEGILRPADFTPIASPPPAFEAIVEGEPTTTPRILPTETSLADVTATIPAFAMATAAPRPPTATPYPIEELLAQEGQTSLLASQEVVNVLVMGTDARPDEFGPSRTDSMMVASINLTVQSVSLISIPRDLWVNIPGYGEGRINTAYFLGELWDNGPLTASQTVAQVLGIPIHHTVVVGFDVFRQTIDSLGGVEINVPEAIDDPLFPDDFYGTYQLVIPAGEQWMDGETALAYARTRHGSSDIQRAERQQLVLDAMRRQVLNADNLPQLPGMLADGFDSVTTTLTLQDVFYLANTMARLERDQIHNHVIQAPLLWNGMTADGAQVLLYEPYQLQSTVQYWLYEDAQPMLALPNSTATP